MNQELDIDIDLMFAEDADPLAGLNMSEEEALTDALEKLLAEKGTGRE